MAKWQLLKLGRLSSLAGVVPRGVEVAVEVVKRPLVDVVVHEVVAAAAPGGYDDALGAEVAKWHASDDMSEKYSPECSEVEDGDAYDSDASSLSDEPDVEGADESEMTAVFW